MKRVITVGLVIIIVFIMAACDLNSDQPSGLTASRGEYATEIHLSWNAFMPNDTSGTPQELKQYILESDESGSFSEVTRTTETSYVNIVTPGIKISYRFCYEYTDDTFSDWSKNTCWGYAITSDNLQITAIPHEYPKTDSNDSGAAKNDPTKADWYLILTQKNWTYHIETYQSSVLVDTQIQIYDKNEFEAISGAMADTALNFEQLDWTCQKSGFYYISVTAASSNDYKISIWHD
ncbi:MAG: hypothetical protein JXR70_15955 [Spirochaetales bacterium]|nr:hypothetical protein [Spirochaetales bacterium]